MKKKIEDLWPGDAVKARPPGMQFGIKCKFVDVYMVNDPASEDFRIALKLRSPAGTDFTVYAHYWDESIETISASARA